MRKFCDLAFDHEVSMQKGVDYLPIIFYWGRLDNALLAAGLL